MYSVPLDLICSAVFPATPSPVSILGVVPAPAGCVGPHLFIGRASDLALTLNVTDVIQDPGYNGPQGPSLTVTVETASSAAASWWRTIGSFTVATVAGTQALSLHGADAWVRVRYVIGTGYSFGFSVSGDAGATVLASAAQSGSGVGPSFDCAQYRSGRMTLACTALSGSLSVILETASNPNAPASAWLPVTTCPALTVPGEIDAPAPNLSRYLRARWTLTGSATFGVSGIALFTFATPSDRARLGLGRAAFPNMSIDEEDSFLVAATDDILDVFGGRFELPIRTHGDSTRRACIHIADWLAIVGRGTEPGKKLTAEDNAFYERYCYYVGNPPGEGGWLARVGKRDIVPSYVTDSDNPATGDVAPRVVIKSLPLRGWGRGGGR